MTKFNGKPQRRLRLFTSIVHDSHILFQAEEWGQRNRTLSFEIRSFLCPHSFAYKAFIHSSGKSESEAFKTSAAFCRNCARLVPAY